MDGSKGDEGGQGVGEIGVGEILEILHKPAVAAQPAEGALDNPASRQDGEAEAYEVSWRGRRCQSDGRPPSFSIPIEAAKPAAREPGAPKLETNLARRCDGRSTST